MADQRTILAAELFKRTLDRPVEQRSAFLDKACRDDVELRREVDSLLKFNTDDDKFLEQPAIEIAFKSFRSGALKPEQRIGSYKVVSQAGSGGMGEVYLAHDEKLNRQVALKLVRFGIAGDETARHFLREAQILASLNHRNIAQLYGAEITPDGFSFLVMEYVEGVRIDKYCNDDHLSVRHRLEMFRRVCGAVQYAHQRLIIHRDIKPANILITKEGEPKLLDFGIAKLVDPEAAIASEQTMTFGAAMTPEYASPEQVRGENVTTATDVYSLGVLLYELLTARRPYRIRSQNPAEIARTIVEQEPARPSTLLVRGDKNSKFLKGDLDNIVLKAMRKEPQRRYASVAQLSEDVLRHLEGRTVIAHKDTIGYRTRKFVKRNKIAVAAAALILLSLIGGIFATALEARRAHRERARAEKRFNDVRQLAHSLMFEIHDSVKDLQGSTPTRRLIVSRALEYLDSLAREAGDNSELQRELATAYEKIGDIQGNPYYANLGDTDGALGSYRKALAIRERPKNVGETAEAKMELGRSHRGLADILEQKGDVAGTVDHYRRSLSIFEQLAAANPGDLSVQDELARAHGALADGLARIANSASERRKSYQTALSIWQNILAYKPSDPKLRRSIAVIFLKLGVASDPKKPDSVENIKRAIVMLEAFVAEDPNNARARREVALASSELGNTLAQAGDYLSALESWRKAFAIRQELAAQDPTNAQLRFDLATTHRYLCEALSITGKSAEALDHAQQALSILEELTDADATNAIYWRDVGLCYEKFADVFVRLGSDEKRSSAQRMEDWNEARSRFEKALRLFSDLRDRGKLMPADSDQPQKLGLRIHECDDAIARLKI